MVARTVWAFSDESERAGVMLVAVVRIEPGGVEDARRALRSLLLAGQRRVHTAKESTTRRRLLLDTVNAISGISAVTWRYRRPPGTDRVLARKSLLSEIARSLVGEGVTAWVLDDVHPAQRLRDRDAIGHVVAGRHLVYDHRANHSEPLLWAADGIAWAVGAGGDWRRRVDKIVTVREIRP
jgi:hypothetical protein